MVIRRTPSSGISSSEVTDNEEQLAINFRLLKPEREYEDEMLYITGSIAELGSWKSEEAPLMICIKPGLWGYAMILDREYFEACKNIFQFSFFVAREHPIYGRTLLKIWNPKPFRSFFQKRREVDELCIECEWSEKPQPFVPVQPTFSIRAPYETRSPYQNPIPVQNSYPIQAPVHMNYQQAHFPQRLSTPFAWYSNSIVQAQGTIVGSNEFNRMQQSEGIRKFEEELAIHEEVRLEDENFAREQQLLKRLEKLRTGYDSDETPKVSRKGNKEENGLEVDSDALQKRSINLGKPDIHEVPKPPTGELTSSDSPN